MTPEDKDQSEENYLTKIQDYWTTKEDTEVNEGEAEPIIEHSKISTDFGIDGTLRIKFRPPLHE